MSSLLDPTELSGMALANRVVMAPITRGRATRDGVPTPEMAVYYGQRTSAGLIITEGTHPSRIGQGYPGTPGLHTGRHVIAWRSVTRAVHEMGGRIFVQLMHTGRIGHPLTTGVSPVAPSAVKPAGTVTTCAGRKPYVMPQAMSQAMVRETICAFTAAAGRAIAAGFDGVELHGGNGYLIHQFLACNTNRRTDGYGGSVSGRIRFVTELVEAVAAEIGRHRVGLRLSPGKGTNDVEENRAHLVYPALVSALPDIAYLHLIAASPDDPLVQDIRRRWRGTLIANPAHGGAQLPDDGGRADAEAWLARGADLVSFGRAFIANPDLVRRFQRAAPLARAEPSTVIGSGPYGYIDYPALDEAAATV
ncbi:alkene reductase [Nonomuraea turkmeniaca]|uniref:Alkene reductase n=1 Tax=Nonomuraea turkmeniaca TaxID=103838 RepID=A0A5S4FYF5_9ACTN|nr:alkene reductase [Nonomuraea turkmeniaca]TMR25612.1 alkene reductase [Nonomuraea turkmeniaca]